MEPQVVKTVSIVGGILLFIAIVAGMTLYTSSSTDKIPNDQLSKDKMTALNDALQSALGHNWPYVLLVFVLILGFALFGLYQGGFSITLGDTGTNRLTLILWVFTALFAIFISIVAVKDYLYKQQNNPVIPNYVPSDDSSSQNKKILELVGLGLFVLIGGGFTVWYLFGTKKINS